VDPSYESEILEYPQTWNRYSYVYNNPLRFTDPDGRCPNCVPAAIGAGIGGLAEGSIDLFSQLAGNHWNIHQVSWSEVGANAAGGAVAGGLAGFTLGGSLLADIAVGGVANMAGGFVNRSIASATYDAEADPFNGNEVSADLIAGAIGGAVGHGVAHRAAELIHAPIVGPYPRQGRNFARRLAAYNSRRAAQQTRAVTAFAVGTAVSTPVTHALDSGLNNGFGSFFDWFNLLFSSLAPAREPQPVVTTRICYPDENGNQVCR
jgi:hypothetical protein